MIKSEWIKLWSVRSTGLALFTAAAFMVGTAVTYSLVIKPGDATPTDALQGAIFAQLAFGVLGVLTVSSEYTTGLIRTTFAAVPQRRRLILAKGGVLFAVLYVAGQLIAYAAFFTAQLLLGRRGVHISLTDQHMALAVQGVGFYMCFIGMFGFCLGVVLRTTAAALSAFFGIVFVGMSVIPGLLPAGYRADVGKFTFVKIAQALATPDHAKHLVPGATDGLLGIGWAWLACAAYLGVAITVPLIVINRRDAV